MLIPEQEKTVSSIKNNKRNPNDGEWHREQSARVKKQEEKKVEAFTEQAIIERERQEEFRRLNSQPSGAFSDVDYMRWVHLHPTLTEAQKAKRIREKQKEIVSERKVIKKPNKQVHGQARRLQRKRKRKLNWTNNWPAPMQTQQKTKGTHPRRVLQQCMQRKDKEDHRNSK